MSKKSLGIAGSYLLKGVSDGFVELFLRSGFGTAQAVFYFAPHQFDWIEIGTVRGLVMQFDARVIKQFLNRLRFMCGKIVHDNDGVGAQFGDKHLLNVGFERQPVHRSIQYHRGDGGFPCDGRDQRRCVPVSMRCIVEYALTFLRTTIKSNHIGFSACFIQEDQAARVNSSQPPAKLFTLEGYIFTPLLDSV